LFLWASCLLAFLWPSFFISHVIVPTINNILDCLFHHHVVCFQILVLCDTCKINLGEFIIT
jgi:hypothetical protein